MRDKLYYRNMLGVTAAAFGHCIFISLTQMALPMFFTDVLLINPASVSAIFLVTRIWDAINDPMMGSLVDRTRTRWGKCRPYLLYGAIPLAILTVLMFTPVEFSQGGKFAYAFVTYMLFITAFTSIDIPMSGIKPLLFTNPTQRNKAQSFSSTFGSLGSLLAVDLFFAMVVVFGGGNDKRGYFITVLMLALIGFVALLTGFFTTKEVVPMSSNKVSFRKVVSTVIHNKYLLIAVAVSICSIATSAYGILLPYFSKWNLADVFSFGAFSVESVLIPVLSTATGVVYMIAVMITPYLLKLADKKKMLIIMSVTGIVANLISFACGYENVILFIVLRIFAHIPPTVTATITSYMIMDCLDYAEYQTGERTEGMTFACNNFLMKTGNAIFSSGILLLLAIYGYDAAVTEPALNIGESIRHNYQHMLDGIFFMMTVFPAIGLALQIIPSMFYRLSDQKLSEIVEELQVRRAAMTTQAEDAENVSMQNALQEDASQAETAQTDAQAPRDIADVDKEE